MLVLRFLIPATKTQDNRDPSDTGTLDLLHGGLLLGYARVSTEDQDLAIQRQKLTGGNGLPAPRFSFSARAPPLIRATPAANLPRQILRRAVRVAPSIRRDKLVVTHARD